MLVLTLNQLACSPPNSRKLLTTVTIHWILFLTWMRRLYWKKLPSGTYISREEKPVPGFKAFKDQHTLILGGNTSGSVKVKPLLVYHSETPIVMKDILKSCLPVIWISNRKAWVMWQIFSEWYSKHFCHSVLQFCIQNSLPRKAVLLLDDTPGHPPNLEDVKSELEIKIVFWPLTQHPCSIQGTKE